MTQRLCHSLFSTIRLGYLRASLQKPMGDALRLRALCDFSYANVCARQTMPDVAPLTASQEEIAFRRRGLALTLEQYGWLQPVEYNVELDQFLPWEVVYLDQELVEVDADGDVAFFDVVE